MKTIATTAALLAVDFIGATAWIASGQWPTDALYIGRITMDIIKFILI